jgi:hypothetical protein
MQIGIGIKLSPNNLSASARVQGFLAATKGAAWDYRTGGTLFSDTGGTTPATAAGAIARANGAMVGSTASMTWTQGTGASQPTWQTTYADHDGTADHLTGDANVRDIFRNTGSGMFGIRFRVSTIAAIQDLFRWEANTGGTIRLMALVNTNGSVSFGGRRLDADANTIGVSSVGLITINTDYTLVGTMDWANGGATALRAYLNGTSIISTSLAGTGVTSDTASNAVYQFGNPVTPRYATGRVYRAIAANAIPTDAQRADIERWLGQ